MRTPSPLVVVAFIGLAAGCSRSKPVASDHLDLVLGDAGRREPVVSAIEMAGEAKTTPVAPARSGAVAMLHARKKARTRSPAPRPKRAPEAEHVPVPALDPQPTIAAAPAPATPAAPAPAPDPAAPQTPDPQPGHGRGDWPIPIGGGVRIPGIPGGVIIIRGGHSGMDPCDEHGRHGIGGGIFPRLPGRGGRGFPGGIVFLRGR